MITKRLLDYDLEIIDITDFKSYYKNNINRFNGFSKKAFLKSIDIPAPYFLEQPEETQEILLDNKDYLINNATKYVGKCLVILSKDGEILNVCKMAKDSEELSYDQLSTITDVEGIIWNKTFYKDGYIQGFIPQEEIKKGKYNRCIVIDFPILLNKPTVLHDGFYKMPTERSIVDEDSFYYNSSVTVDYMDYQHIALAIDGLFSETDEVKPVDEAEQVFILRENDDIVSALLDNKVIPKTISLGLLSSLNKKTVLETLTHDTLVEVLLAFEGNLKNIKQVSALRTCYDFIQTEYASDKKEEALT